MAKRASGTGGKRAKAVSARSHLQRGRQQGSNTGKDAWKSNQKHFDSQPGTGQVGQRPRAGEPFGSTPGEVRGHPGGKRGQAMGGQRGTTNSVKARSKRRQAVVKAGRRAQEKSTRRPE